MPDSYHIRSVATEDHSEWLTLWQQYLVFYRASLAEATTALLWQRLLDPAHSFRCFVAVDTNTQRLAGIVHFFAHPDTWESELVCYLEDLYVDQPARGVGVGAALIEAVRNESERCGWSAVYWHTMHDNTRARGLYDKLTGGTDGFVTYRLSPPPPPAATSSDEPV